MAEHAHNTPARPHEPSLPAAGRRSLFGAVTALACKPVLGMSAVPDPDAGLIRLCNAFHEAHRATEAAPDDTDEWERHLDRRWEISDALERMTASTRGGHLAKLKVALVLMVENLNGSRHDDFILSTLEAFTAGGEA